MRQIHDAFAADSLQAHENTYAYMHVHIQYLIVGHVELRQSLVLSKGLGQARASAVTQLIVREMQAARSTWHEKVRFEFWNVCVVGLCFRCHEAR